MSYGRARTALIAPNDQPWSQPFRFWLDQARTQPLNLEAAGGWLQWPGGSAKVVLELPLAANVVTLGLAQEDLAALRLGTWWGELQFKLPSGAPGSLRFDLKIDTGFGTGLGATFGSAPTQDVVVCATAPTDVVMLAIGVGGAAEAILSPAVQQLLGVTNADDALAALARPLPPSVETELLATLGTNIATLQDILILLCRQTGLLSPGGGFANPAL